VDRNVKSLLVDALNPTSEFDELLGSGKGNVRRCFNSGNHTNGDKSPSLSFNPKHGGWKCHTCGEHGDIFSLYMKMKGWDFPTTLQNLLQKYGLWKKAGNNTKPVYAKQVKAGDKTSKFNIVADAKVRDSVISAVAWWDTDAPRLQFMMGRYGINKETLQKYCIGYDKHPGSGRVLIPVFVDVSGRGINKDGRALGALHRIVNVRKHDVFRTFCVWEHESSTKENPVVSRKRPDIITPQCLTDQELWGWQPKWDGGLGKVISVKGHGGPYLYPMQVMYDSPFVYVVGGELKALLLNQLGVPAVAWTGGEGQYAEELLPLFIGKSVRVLLDVDQTGVDGTFGREPGTNGPNDKGVVGLAQVLANVGASVEAGRWPAEVAAELPDKGDVTDFLKKAGWDAAALEYLDWVKVERQELPLTEDVGGVGAAHKREVLWDDMRQVAFRDLVNPVNVGAWVRFDGMVSGRGEAPYVVPRRCEVSCVVGRTDPMPICKGCRLPSAGYQTFVELTAEQQVEMVGTPKDIIQKLLAGSLGVPVKCTFAEYRIDQSAVEQVIFTPTVDIHSPTGDDKTDFEFSHRSGFLIREDRIEIRENTTYTFGGHLISNPKTSQFTIAIREFKAAHGDILHHQNNDEMSERLRGVVHGDGTVTERIFSLVADVRDYVTKIYGSDEMTLAILLSYFLPFQIKIGDQNSERVCPAVMVLGDTTVGKSTVTKNLNRHFGAGRFKTMDAKPTFVGLVGGNIPHGNRMAFSWGLLPTSHRAHVGLDEFSKLPLEDVGRLTNLLSSGMAERLTANGDRSTLAHVRMLYLTNPRGSKSLKSVDAYEAALEVMGTVQDLGRLEYLHIQHELRDRSLFTRQHVPAGEHRWTTDLARYHLGWAWSLTRDRIRIVDPQHVLVRAAELSERFGGNTLLLPAMARFKVARLAAGLAGLVYSTDGYNLVVGREHVDAACDFIERNYSKFLHLKSSMATLPGDIVKLFDQVRRYENLHFLTVAERFSRDDVSDVLDNMGAQHFIRLAHMTHGLLTKDGRFYRFTDDRIKERIAEYLTTRKEHERHA